LGLESLANDKAVLQLKWSGAEKLFGAVGIDIAELQNQIDSTMTPNSFIFEDIKVNLKTELEPVYEQTANIVGYFEGNDPELKNEVIIVGAHYDHVGYGEFGSTTKSFGEIHNGADDNASGTVAILEIAEALSMIKDDLKRTVLFIAFSGEEYGLLGSTHYISYPIFPLHDTVLMINFDMVGNLIDKNFVVGNSADFTKNILTDIDESETYPFDITLMGPIGGSDHAVFGNSGIPIIFPTTGLHVRYHTPDDDAEYINFEGLTQITRLIYELIYRVDLISNSLIGAN
jgi:Zn-dependent M28 family amino/carboxypeptidase